MTLAVIPAEEMPEAIARVLDVSILEDRPARLWLNDPAIDTARKACLLNILAVMCITPTDADPLIERLLDVFTVQAERIGVVFHSGIRSVLDDLVADPGLPFYQDVTPPEAVHTEMLRAIPRPLMPAYFAQARLASFRSDGPPSLQIVVAASSLPYTVADIDIDLWNPLQDVAGLFGHQLFEIIPNLWRRLWGKPERPTDQIALRAELARGPAAPWLCYTLT